MIPSVEQMPFIGRNEQIGTYHRFLNQSEHWLLLITGVSGSGKSYFLRYLQHRAPEDDILVLRLDFADTTLQTDPLKILTELSRSTTRFCDEQAVASFRQQVREGQLRLVQDHKERLQAFIEHESNKNATDNELEQLLSTFPDLEATILNDVTQALLQQIATLPQNQRLVVTFDTCEWLEEEPEKQRVRSWLLEEFLPKLHDHRPCHIMMASRQSTMPQALKQARYDSDIELKELEEPAALDHMQNLGMDEETRKQIYYITSGHPLCFSIMCTLWQEEHQTNTTIPINNLEQLENKYTEKALVEFVLARLDSRLSMPYRHWAHYGVLLKRFNRQLLQTVFEELPGDEEQYKKFISYPFIEHQGNGWYAIHEVLRAAQVEIIRHQEPTAWQRYHQRAQRYYKKQPEPAQYEHHYHTAALEEIDELIKCGALIHKALGLNASLTNLKANETSAKLLLQALQDKALKFSVPGQILYEDSKKDFDLQQDRKKKREILKRLISTNDDDEVAKQAEKALGQLNKRSQEKRISPAHFWILSIVTLLTISSVGVYGLRLLLPLFSPNQVTTSADDGPGSLRNVIANDGSGNPITFSPQLQGTITLSKNLDIKKDVTVVGPDIWPITISNNHNQNVHIHIGAKATVTFVNLTFANSLVLKQSFLENEGKLTLNHCTVQNNISYDNGGGITNNGGIITIDNSNITGNFASSNGGGIYNSNNGILTVTTSMISSNTAFENGGGIYSITGTVILNKTTIQKNQTVHNKLSRGGSIAVLDSQLSITSSTITGNWTSGKGGGISMLGSQGTMSNSIASSNIAANSSESSGNEMAIEQESGNQKTSSLIITSLLPKPPLSPNDIIGVSILSQNSLEIDSTTSNGPPNGTPASQSSPENTSNYAGNIDLGQYCQKIYSYSSFDANNPFHPACIDTKGTKHPVDPLQVCQERYPGKNITTDRLADYFNPASWQCYTNATRLGPASMADHVAAFCQSNNMNIANNPRTTAYDWKCLHQGGTIGHYPIHLDNFPVGLSVGDLCQSVYRNKAAPNSTVMERLADYNNPEGWECWELQAPPPA